MLKEDVVAWLDTLFELKDQLAHERDSLVAEFEKEFPPLVGARGGYLLVFVDCGRAGCTECPHSIAWRWYRRPKRKVLFGKRFPSLPSSFWRSSRPVEVKERFRYYDRKMRELNITWKEMQKKIMAIQATARATVNKLTKRR